MKKKGRNVLFGCGLMMKDVCLSIASQLKYIKENNVLLVLLNVFMFLN